MGMADEAPPDADEVKAKRVGKYVTYVGLALIGLVPALTAHQCAVGEAKTAAAKVAATTVDVAAKAKSDGQATKNEAEAGYQVTRQAMEALEHRVLVLERATSRRRPRPAPKPLPTDLKKAEAVVFAGAPAPPAPPVAPPAQHPDARP